MDSSTEVAPIDSVSSLFVGGSMNFLCFFLFFIYFFFFFICFWLISNSIAHTRIFCVQSTRICASCNQLDRKVCATCS